MAGKSCLAVKSVSKFGWYKRSSTAQLSQRPRDDWCHWIFL